MKERINPIREQYLEARAKELRIHDEATRLLCASGGISPTYEHVQQRRTVLLERALNQTVPGITGYWSHFKVSAIPNLVLEELETSLNSATSWVASRELIRRRAEHFPVIK